MLIEQATIIKVTVTFLSLNFLGLILIVRLLIVVPPTYGIKFKENIKVVLYGLVTFAITASFFLLYLDGEKRDGNILIYKFIFFVILLIIFCLGTLLLFNFNKHLKLIILWILFILVAIISAFRGNISTSSYVLYIFISS
jgi:hypothetical protein